MKLFLSLLFLFASGFAAVSAQSDPFIREHTARRAKNPKELLFTVQVKDNRKQFQFGEVIPLELSFAASKPNTFKLDAGTYDRSGRLHTDSFVVDRRADVIDPLHDYFHSGFFIFMGGGLRGIPDLTDKPHVITAELNEWLRLEKPGRYRLYVVSNRVGTDGSGVVSNVIDFEVLPPDQKWANQKLNEITSALSKRRGDLRLTCRTLRFLGTTAAATEIRKRFRGDDSNCDWEYKFGLIGSPHRDFVIRDMESALSSAEQPVTATYISTLALLAFTRQATWPTPGPYPSGNDERIKQWQVEAERRNRAYQQLCLNYVRQLILAIPQKQGEARATSLQTILDYRPQLSAAGFSEWSTLIDVIPDVFSRLPKHAQVRMLQYQWKSIASEAMVPVLRGVYKDALSKPDNVDQEDWFAFHRQEELRSFALRRLYQLSPEEGRQLILDEIRRPKPRIDGKVLRSLPDETLPEVDSTLLANLEMAVKNGSRELDVISELIERYATDQILARLRGIFEAPGAGKWACRPQAALLAYFLRVDPSVGGEYLKQAVAARGEKFSRCFTSALPEVARLHMSAEVEDVAIASLKDEDKEVVSQAASVLGKFGSAEAEKMLWQRMEDWHEAMQSRSEQLDKYNSIEDALRNALTNGRGWLLDPEKLKRLRELCLTEKGRGDIDRLIRGWNYDISVGWSPFDDDEYEITVGHYELKSLDSLKQKLLQFPKGTLFRWKKGDAQEFQQIKTYLEEHGMKLERAVEKTSP